MKFKKLFTLQIRHEYFGIHSNNSIRIIPDEKTAELIKNCRLRVSENPMELILFQPYLDDGTTPLLSIDNETEFAFRIISSDKIVPFVTDFEQVSLQQTLQGKAFLLFNNYNLTGSNSELNKIIHEPTNTEILTVKTPSENERFYLKGRLMSGLSANEIQIEGLTGISSPIQYSEEHKTVQINTSSASKGQKLTLQYRVLNQIPDCLGLISIRSSEIQTPAPVYAVNFLSLEQNWIYYIILPSGATGATIDDEYLNRPDGLITFTSEIIDSNSAQTEFEEKLLAQYNGSNVIKFESERNIKYQSEARNHLRLAYLPASSSSPLDINHLRNPHALNRGIEIICLTL